MECNLQHAAFTVEVTLNIPEVIVTVERISALKNLLGAHCWNTRYNKRVTKEWWIQILYVRVVDPDTVCNSYTIPMRAVLLCPRAQPMNPMQPEGVWYN